MALQVNLTPTTISDIEQTVQTGLEALRNAPLNAQITAALKFLTPSGYRPIAQLEEDGRKKRSTAAASNWNPETGEIVIYFERLSSEASTSATAVSQSPSVAVANPSRWREELLAAASDTPGGALVAVAQQHAANSSSTSSAEFQRVEPPHAFSAEPQDISALQIQQCCLALAEAEKAGKAFIALKWFRDNELSTRGYAWTESVAYRHAVLTKAIEVEAILTASIPNPKAPQHPTTTIRLNRESKYAQAVAPRFQPIQLRGEGPSGSEILLRDRERF